MTLLDKLRKARESTVEAGGFVFTVRRPTDAEAAGLSGSTALDVVHRFVIGWNLKEMDVIPGGGPGLAGFDPGLWAAWVDDRPELWAPLSEAILSAYQRHAEQREDDAKN